MDLLHIVVRVLVLKHLDDLACGLPHLHCQSLVLALQAFSVVLVRHFIFEVTDS